MTLRVEKLTVTMGAVAAALHEAAGFHETWTIDAFNGLLAAGAEGLLAVLGDAPVGLILWRVAADEAEILTICTVPAKRRRGVGRRLMEAAKARLAAAGTRRLFLEVAVDNDAAIALYRAFGFTDAGLRRAYYIQPDGPVDALVMALTLS
jgi:ribosomal-protein-alanine N-acetyltransferase